MINSKSAKVAYGIGNLGRALVMMLFALKFYPLGKEKVQELRAKLDALHDGKIIQ